MKKLKLHLDAENQPKKPIGRKIGAISNRVTQQLTECTPAELADFLTPPYSRTMVPGIMNGKRKNENWTEQQVFAIDIDSDLNHDQAIERLKSFGLSCTFSYSTFSCGPEKDKYRLVFVLPEPIKEKKKYKMISQYFKWLFPEMDKHCTHESAMFHGGKEILSNDYEFELSIFELKVAAEMHYASQAESERAIQKRLQKCSDFDVSLYNYIESPKNEQIYQVKEFDWDWATTHVSVLREFLDNKWLYHPQLFGLATNLLYVNGGLKKMKEVMEQTGKYTKNNFMIIPYVRKMKYKPMRLENFSPYHDDHGYKNLLEAGRLKKGQVIQLENFTGEQLEKIRKNLKTTMGGILESEDNDIHVVKAATGIGKTENILDLESVTVSCPTHELKNEISGRFRGDSITSPDPIVFSNPDINNRIEYLYRCGSTSKAHKLLKSIANKELINMNYTKEDSYNAGCFLDKSDLIRKTDRTVITTHHTGIHLYKHPIQIFDEDPFQTNLLPIECVESRELKKLRNSTKNIYDRGIMDKIIMETGKAQPNVCYELPDFAFADFSALEDAVAKDTFFRNPILKFFKSRFYTVDERDPGVILFVGKESLSARNKIIILSATANEWIYRQMFGERLKFYDFGDVELKGELLQDTTYPFSRQNFSKKEKGALDYAVEKAGERLVITFAKYQPYFKHPVENVYFGNTTGTDKLNGESICVAGCPHINRGVYILFARMLGLDINPTDYDMSYQRVRHNGLEFKFMTFENLALRNIQFYFIESELRQAIGRARLVNGGSVLLLSGYPLPESTFINQSNYQKLAA